MINEGRQDGTVDDDVGKKYGFYQSADRSHLTDADNIKHSDLTGVDNDNKHTSPSGQDDQTEPCFFEIAKIA
ncbi:MAG: hypothetical protein ACXV8P_08020 [Methylobacter sp.]